MVGATAVGGILLYSAYVRDSERAAVLQQEQKHQSRQAELRAELLRSAEAGGTARATEALSAWSREVQQAKLTLMLDQLQRLHELLELRSPRLLKLHLPGDETLSIVMAGEWEGREERGEGRQRQGVRGSLGEGPITAGVG